MSIQNFCQVTPTFHLVVWWSHGNNDNNYVNKFPLPTLLTINQGTGEWTLLQNLLIIKSPIPLWFLLRLVLWLHFRHWSQIPSSECGLPAQLHRVQSPDGTYLASEFNYSLPRRPKGYNTVGYKHYDHGRSEQADPRFWTNVRANRENDKGYHSDRTYESPVC